ncbi:hypothetical protein ACI78T_16670 [Blastococcus sp. SYSU D00922]
MTVIPLPRHGQWAWDLRGEGRAVRVTAHVDAGVMNLSLWRGGICVGSAQLLPGDVAKLANGLTEGLAEIATQSRTDPAGDPVRIAELEGRLAEVEARLGRPAPRRTVATAVGAVRSALVSRGLRAVVRAR